MKATFTGNGERVTLTDNERDLGHGKQIEVICNDSSKIWAHIEDLIDRDKELKYIKMKTVEELRSELKGQLQDCIHANDGSIAAQVDDSIQWAWDNWEDDIVATFFEGEKPECYNEKFRDEWIDNEPFDIELERINNPE